MHRSTHCDDLDLKLCGNFNLKSCFESDKIFTNKKRDKSHKLFAKERAW